MSDAFWVGFWLAIPQIFALILTWMTARAAGQDAAKAVKNVAVIGEKVANIEKVNGGSGAYKLPNIPPKN